MNHGARVTWMGVVFSCLGLVGCASSSGAKPAATAAAAEAAAPLAAEAQSRPKVDLVFVLDTTGSMSGLLASAKAKIWELARKAQEGKPAPELRVGLVAYRDVNDDYVTKVLELTPDLDQVYAVLSDFQAGGGGDTPEHVLKGLHDALEKMPWSADRNAVKLIYLVGDAPPHFDYQDGITQEGVLRSAAQKGVRISAIRCGTLDTTLAAFTNIARPTDGDVATIEQGGGVVATVATPYDDTLAKLNAELTATEVRYGSDAERADADKVAERNLAAPAAAQAERAAFYGARSAGAVRGATKKDLVSLTPAEIAALPDAQLPEEMRKMTPAQRVQHIEAQRKKRDEVLAKVRAASADRDGYLKKSAPARAAAAPKPSFDSKVFDSLKKAAAAKGLAY